MSSPTEPRLSAGAAKVDISPALGIQIAGDIGRRRPCTSVKEKIYARALVLKQDGKMFCIVALDVMSIDTPWSNEIRKRAREKFALPPEAVMIHVTHNHGAPSLGNHFCRDESKLIPADMPWLRGGDEAYNGPCVDGTIEAIGKAIERLTPVTMAAGRGIDGRVAFNRRYMLRDGTALCQPPQCDPRILKVEGPMDPEVGVITFTADDGRVVSALLHYTCHPCNGFWGNDVIGDWPGTWCREMEAHFGESCTPLMLNGCAGNLIHRNFLDPNAVDQDNHVEQGMMLAASAKRALTKMTPVASSKFSWKTSVVAIPWRNLTDEEIVQASALLKEQPKPVWKDPIRVGWDWVFAVGILDVADERKMVPKYQYEIQALRIGDFALVAVMGEPFVEAQLRVKAESPFPFTHMAQMCNGFASYIPTRAALIHGGYETRVGRTSRFGPEALEIVETGSVNLLKELYNA